MLSSVLLVSWVMGAQASDPASPPSEADAAAITAAKTAAQTLGSTLKARVVASMQADGPAATLDVCHDEAPSLTAGVSEASGVKVGRASLRRRNPDNTGPDWVAAWLEQTGERKAAGIEPVVSVVDTEDGRVARFLAPIAVGAPCITCHGDKESLAAPIQAALDKHYPADAATGYAPGDLRGVVWAEAPVKQP